MALLTIEQARSQCRVVGTHHDDDLEDCIEGAVSAAVGYLNRDLFADQAALDAALDAAPGKMRDAHVAYEAAAEVAKGLEGVERAAALAVAEARLKEATRQFHRTIDGMVAKPRTITAIRMILGHLFENRESVVTGPIAIEVPMGAKDLLRPDRKVMMP